MMFEFKANHRMRGSSKVSPRLSSPEFIRFSMFFEIKFFLMKAEIKWTIKRYITGSDQTVEICFGRNPSHDLRVHKSIALGTHSSYCFMLRLISINILNYNLYLNVWIVLNIFKVVSGSVSGVSYQSISQTWSTSAESARVGHLIALFKFLHYFLSWSLLTTFFNRL